MTSSSPSLVATLALLAACGGTNASPTDGATDGDGSADGPGADASVTPQVTEYAPYFYTWGWGSHSYAFSSLVDMKSQGGPTGVTIAFVLSNSGNCQTTAEIQNNLDDVHAYIAAGGHVRASFGGAFGTYLENACPSSDALASAISAFVDATHIIDLDFDIEQGTTSSNSGINARRGAALKKVQAAKGIHVTFTLPVNPSGLTSLGKNVVQAALDAGVTVSYVNVMTMDYGNNTDLGAVPIQSVDATAAQVRTMFGISLDEAYRKVGVTAMIGHNDDTSVFSLANASALVQHVKQHRVGLLSFWAIQRDQACASGLNEDTCNGAASAKFAFHQVFNGVTH
jgi:chitinase